MKRRRPTIPPKTPVLLGCEGNSEVGYGQFLGGLLRDRRLPVHLDVVPLSPGTGDPLSRVERMVSVGRRRRNTRIGYAAHFVLMDDDRNLQEPAKAAAAIRLAKRHSIHIIWQSPCHEALLLRHLPGMEHRRPMTSTDAERALLQAWPGYAKPMTSLALGALIGLDDVRRAASVEPDLAAFLTHIRLIP